MKTSSVFFTIPALPMRYHRFLEAIMITGISMQLTGCANPLTPFDCPRTGGVACHRVSAIDAWAEQGYWDPALSAQGPPSAPPATSPSQIWIAPTTTPDGYIQQAYWITRPTALDHRVESPPIAGTTP